MHIGQIITRANKSTYIYSFRRAPTVGRERVPSVLLCSVRN